ncbi:hypothetical protein Fmac_008640 [Flemingia macrophylla]|uniref:Uncharacterized protein n=1 Tax=Flemingia macrophylla TaxID=520843 RepID=A0ABD1N0D7_9FABA
MAEAPPITPPLLIVTGNNNPRLPKFFISNIDWFLPNSKDSEHLLLITGIIEETQSSKLLFRRYGLGPHELPHNISGSKPWAYLREVINTPMLQLSLPLHSVVASERDFGEAPQGIGQCPYVSGSVEIFPTFNETFLGKFLVLRHKCDLSKPFESHAWPPSSQFQILQTAASCEFHDGLEAQA